MKRLRTLGSAPVFPSVLALGALLMGLPWLRILLLGLLAVGLTGLCALSLHPKEATDLPSGWRRNLRGLKRTLERIKNRTVYRCGHEILTELKQCESGLPYLSSAARREITDYYLPTFSKYFSSYATFEECNEGNPVILATMEQMESALEQIADSFRKICDRNDRTTALTIHAETALLSKKLKGGEELRDRPSTEPQ